MTPRAGGVGARPPAVTMDERAAPKGDSRRRRPKENRMQLRFLALAAALAALPVPAQDAADGRRAPDASAGPRLEKLWETALRSEGLPAAAEKVVLFPCGLRVIALDARTGEEIWRYAFTEDRAGLEMPARVQGVAVVALRPGQGIVIAIGSTEIHGLTLSSGRVLWSHRERTACTLALSIVADIDGDGVRDAVASGCDSVVCVSSVSGAVLWHYPISGRSWWTADAGDLDGDGRGEVLVFAGGTLHAVRAAASGSAATLWSAAVPMQPHAAFPQPRGVVLLFPTGAVERRAGGDGAVLWRARPAAGKIADARPSSDGHALLVSAEESCARIALGDAACAAFPHAAASAGALAPEAALLFLGFANGEAAAVDCAARVELARAAIAKEPIEAILAARDGTAFVLTRTRAIGVRATGGPGER